MKRFLFAIFTLTLGLSLTAGAFAQEKETAGKKDTLKEVQKEINTLPGQVVEDGKPVNTICLVSGEEADANIIYAYNGKTYAFCCNKCLKKFKADPEKYIGRMEKNEKPADKSGKESSE